MAEKKIAPPHIYAEWVRLINAFKEKSDDEAVLYAAQNGTLEWQSGVAERFTQKYIEAINSAINSAIDRFQRAAMHTGNENILVSDLLYLRKEMCFLSDMANIPSIPADYRSQYVKLVRDKANEIQEALEDSAKKDRTGRLLYIIKKNKINVFQ